MKFKKTKKITGLIFVFVFMFSMRPVLANTPSVLQETKIQEVDPSNRLKKAEVYESEEKIIEDRFRTISLIMLVSSLIPFALFGIMFAYLAKKTRDIEVLLHEDLRKKRLKNNSNCDD